MRVGVYPGSFNPITIAHVAIAHAALEQCDLGRVDLVMSRVALAKEDVTRPRLEDRLAVVQAALDGDRRLAVRITDDRLLVHIAAGYDVLILGADKWQQIQDPAWYGGSNAARDHALARLPEVVVAPRPPFASGAAGRTLRLPAHHGSVSSTDARTGRREWMHPAAAAFDERTGAWSDAARYDAWVAAERPD